MARDPLLLLEAALTSDPDAPIPAWYDITSRIHWPGGDITTEAGRQTELDDIDPSKLAGTLKNADGALTPRNPDAPSPYRGNWEQGKKIRLLEVMSPDTSDTFQRTVASGWGTNDAGHTYSVGGSAGYVATDHSVVPGAGRMRLPAASATRAAGPTIATPANVQVITAVIVPVVPAGAGILLQHFVRLGADYYSLNTSIEAGGAITATITHGGTVLTTAATGLTHTATTTLWTCVQAIDTELRIKIWQGAQVAEPDTWTATAVDSSVTSGGTVLLQASAQAGLTTVPVTVSYTYFEVAEVFALHTGYLEAPSVRIDQPDVAQPCAVSAIDRLGRLARITAYDGNLAEYIKRYGHSAGQLVLHMPLSDEAGPWMARDRPEVTRMRVGGFGDIPVPKEPEELILPANAAGPPGDDQSYADWDPVFDTNPSIYLGYASLTLPIQIDVAATETVAVSGWWRPRRAPDLVDTAAQVFPELMSLYGDLATFAAGEYGVLSVGAYSTSRFEGADVVIDQFIRARIDDYVTTAGTDLSITTPTVQWGEWRLVTVRFNLATKVLDLWIGNTVVAQDIATTVTVNPGGMRMRILSIGSLMSGPIAHLQIRTGTAPMTYAEHLAQHRFGFGGLDRQTVAERIATVAAYAGVPVSQVRLDKGASTPMQRISMRGKPPAQLMQEAAQTGQDVLHCDGWGNLTLVARQRRYSQPAAAQIPFGWLAAKTMSYKPESPITEVTATRTGRGSATKRNTAASDQYGVRSTSYQLDTAVDADPANLAAWTLRAYSQMRTRIPALRISLDRRTLSERKSLQRLKIGDRIQLTGMPAGSPDDVADLIIQGIKHTRNAKRAVIEFNTSPVLGDSPGQLPSCPVVGSAVIGANTRLAY